MKILKLILLCCLSILSANAFSSSQPKKIWEHWEVHDPLSTECIDHSAWQHFLDQHRHINRRGIAVIDYQNVSSADRKQLAQYIYHLSTIKISNYNRHAQLAFWLNLYNALVVKTIIDHYPVGSINDINISPGLFTEGPWSADMVKVENIPLSLKDIEHRILRPIWNDPRVHYALNYGSIGSPNMMKTAFTASNTEQLLNHAAHDFINSLRGIQVIDGKLITSKIYEWFIDDFGGDDIDIIAHIRFFAEPRLRTSLQGITHIHKTVFNWHVNKDIASV